MFAMKILYSFSEEFWSRVNLQPLLRLDSSATERHVRNRTMHRLLRNEAYQNTGTLHAFWMMLLPLRMGRAERRSSQGGRCNLGYRYSIGHSRAAVRHCQRASGIGGIVVGAVVNRLAGPYCFRSIAHRAL